MIKNKAQERFRVRVKNKYKQKEKKTSTKGHSEIAPLSLSFLVSGPVTNLISTYPPKHCLHRHPSGLEGKNTRRAVFITPLPSLGITQISLDILADERGNKESELLAC